MHFSFIRARGRLRYGRRWTVALPIPPLFYTRKSATVRVYSHFTIHFVRPINRTKAVKQTRKHTRTSAYYLYSHFVIHAKT